MARVRYVTRTIQSTKVTLMVANTETASIEDYELELAGVFKDEKAIMKAVEKTITEENIKPVAVKSTEVKETLYRMNEQKFIANAEIAPPRVKKEDGSEEIETVEEITD